VGNVISLVLGALDALHSGGYVSVILEKITQLAGSGGNVVRHICKKVEKLGFARNEAHNAEKSPVELAGQLETGRVCNLLLIGS
jgi:hypothetical protein